MNDEIKETLARLNKIVPYADVPKELAYMTTNITPQECKTILDYITNLQQRIEKAVEYIGEYKDYCDKEVCDCTPEYFEDLLNILNGKE